MSNDTINRNDVLEAVRKAMIFAPTDEYLRVMFAIDGIPSADRPQGEWIDKGKNLWKCSNCEMIIYSESEQDRNEFHKWCSSCGCRMKGADDES